MFVAYLIIIVVFILMFLCALTPFFLKWNKSIPKEDGEACKLLSSTSSRVKRACKYECPHCGNKLLPNNDGIDVMCYKCGHLWHPDYILTVYEDEDCD